jgi:hypothetical protein
MAIGSVPQARVYHRSRGAITAALAAYEWIITAAVRQGSSLSVSVLQFKKKGE